MTTVDIAVPMPKGLKSFFNRPPILASESRFEYNSLLKLLAEQLVPDGPLEWLMLKDILESMWEMRQLKNIKAGLIDIMRKHAVGRVLKSVAEGETQEERDRFVDDKLEAWSRGDEARDEVEAFVSLHGAGNRELQALSMSFRLHENDLVDRQIERARANMARMLHEFEYFRDAASWKMPKAVHEIVEQPVNLLPVPKAQDTVVQ